MVISGEFAKHKARIYAVVAELFANALDHGILDLDSGMKSGAEGFEAYYQERQERLLKLKSGVIKMGLEFDGNSSAGRVIVRMEDSGRGFDFSCEQSVTEAGMDPYRRGMAMVGSLCEQVEYLGNGNTVLAIYAWDEPSGK